MFIPMEAGEDPGTDDSGTNSAGTGDDCCQYGECQKADGSTTCRTFNPSSLEYHCFVHVCPPGKTCNTHTWNNMQLFYPQKANEPCGPACSIDKCEMCASSTTCSSCTHPYTLAAANTLCQQPNEVAGLELMVNGIQ